MSRVAAWGLLLLCLALVISSLAPGLAASSSYVAVPRGIEEPSGDVCPALPPPTGNVVDVSTVAELQAAVNNAVPNTTIRIADGTYNLNGVCLRIDVPNVTLRSASGNCEAVVLDGNYVTTEIIQIVASNVTIADLTLREAYYHPIHIMSTASSNTVNTLIYNVHVIDPGQQAIKINPVAGGYYTDDGEIACSRIELTDAGRPYVWDINESCYTGGVDAHQSWGWVIRDNEIEGFWCENGLSEHAVHFWRACRATLVERNVLVDNARGVGFGLDTNGDARTYPDNPCPAAGGGYVDHYDGIIRNNFVFARRSELFASEYGFDCGICLWNACGAQAVHNTIASTQDPFSSIEWRFDYTDVDIVNNLASYRLLERGGTAHLSGNLEYQPLSLFVDGPGGDLHLVATATDAIDQGVPVTPGLCDDDIDGDARPIGPVSDVGADEYGIPPPARVTDLRVTQAVTSTDVLTATLRWTAPADAITTTLRYSRAIITAANWPVASPLTDTLPGDAEVFTAVVPFDGDTIYFALKSHNTEGGWSDLSNNTFWPQLRIFLPFMVKDR